jgi:Protein of unknown function (DUF3185)
MQKSTGIIFLLIGLAVLIEGRKIADHFGSRVQPIFNGAPTDRAIYIYVCGVVIALLGVAQFFWRRK